MKKRTKRKTKQRAMLEIGPKPEAIRQVRDSMVAILKTKADPHAQVEAVRAIGKMAEIGPVAITNCTFRSID